jgi:membrane-bound lytic murein transglycosylase MltF
MRNAKKRFAVENAFTAMLSIGSLALCLAGCSQYSTSEFMSRKSGGTENPRENAILFAGETVATSSFHIHNPSIAPLVRTYSKQYGVDWILALSVLRQESRFSDTAVSEKGAYGLMQLMPLTQIELSEKIGVDEATSPKNNLRAGIYHLKSLKKVFEKASPKDQTCLALAAYNCGLGRICDAQKVAVYMGNDPMKWPSVRTALVFLSRKNYTLHKKIWEEGVPPSGYFRDWRQTVAYVDEVMKHYDDYSLAMK